MPAYPNQNESWKIKSIESKRKIIILSNGTSELKFYSISSIPVSWVAGEEVHEPEMHDEKRSKKLFILKNKTKDGRPDGYLIGASGDIIKSLGSAVSKSTPVLGVPLKITDIYSDNVIEVGYQNNYSYVPELNSASGLDGWRIGQYVKVSKRKIGFEMYNLEIKNSIIVSHINDEETE